MADRERPGGRSWGSGWGCRRLAPATTASRTARRLIEPRHWRHLMMRLGFFKGVELGLILFCFIVTHVATTAHGIHRSEQNSPGLSLSQRSRSEGGECLKGGLAISFPPVASGCLVAPVKNIPREIMVIYSISIRKTEGFWNCIRFKQSLQSQKRSQNSHAKIQAHHSQPDSHHARHSWQ